MNFQASSTEEEARALAKVPVPSAETMGIESFKVWVIAVLKTCSR